MRYWGKTRCFKTSSGSKVNCGNWRRNCLNGNDIYDNLVDQDKITLRRRRNKTNINTYFSPSTLFFGGLSSKVPSIFWYSPLDSTTFSSSFCLFSSSLLSFSHNYFILSKLNYSSTVSILAF